ncbi:MAG: NAD-dependent epimerase/dehydratase family protein [Acidimicrobiales bacterium]
MARTCVVTGSAGFIGSRLSSRLLEEGWNVRGIDAFTDSYDPAEKVGRALSLIRHPHYEHIDEDLVDLSMGPVLRDAEAVFHLAGRPGVRESFRLFDKYRHDNIEATAAVLAGAVAAPSVRRLVYASSSSVYGNAPVPFHETGATVPISPYGQTKLQAEQMCLATSGSDLECVALRYFTVYGPGQRPDMGLRRFIESAVGELPITLYGDGTQSRDFTFVDDVVEATLRALTAPVSGLAINIGGGEPIVLNAVFELLAELRGGPLQIRQEAFATGDALHTAADLSRAADLLGFTAEVRFRDGLAAEFDWIAGAHATVGEPA